jgi:hypothetical protein
MQLPIKLFKKYKIPTQNIREILTLLKNLMGTCYNHLYTKEAIVLSSTLSQELK